jgi:hypothetical protein
MDEIKEFDELPDDAAVPRRVAAAILHISERTVRRSVPTIRLSPRRCGNRVGDIRAIARGNSPDVGSDPTTKRAPITGANAEIGWTTGVLGLDRHKAVDAEGPS